VATAAGPRKKPTTYRSPEFKKKVDILIDGPKLLLRNKGKKLKESLEHYFLPFHSSEGGLGLGLYIAKSILDIHNATLSYAREKDDNSFIVKIPLSDSDQESKGKRT
jgi:nitrogen-specific signal transduction histidine kinase